MNTNKSRSARRAVQLVLATGVAVIAAQPVLADDAFLKISGLPGGSTDSKHKDEINVLSFSQSVSGSGCPEFSINKPVDPASDLYKNLVDAMDAVRDPAQMVRVDQYDSLLFNLKANLVIDARYIAADVLIDAETALKDAYAFARRSFGQPVTAAEAITTGLRAARSLVMPR